MQDLRVALQSLVALRTVRSTSWRSYLVQQRTGLISCLSNLPCDPFQRTPPAQKCPVRGRTPFGTAAGANTFLSFFSSFRMSLQCIPGSACFQVCTPAIVFAIGGARRLLGSRPTVVQLRGSSCSFLSCCRASLSAAKERTVAHAISWLPSSTG